MKRVFETVECEEVRDAIIMLGAEIRIAGKSTDR